MKPASLSGYDSGAAASTRERNRAGLPDFPKWQTKGSIEPGKLVNLVVRSHDPVATLEPFASSGALDADAVILATGSLEAQINMVGGKVMHQA